MNSTNQRMRRLKLLRFILQQLEQSKDFNGLDGIYDDRESARSDIVAEIDTLLNEISEIDEYNDRETYRQESQWDPANIADIMGYYDGPELAGELSNDPYDTMYE